ncbi:putative tail fiber protein [Arthrobacter phage vB_ArtM-ArV1]|uniref:Putative tail fiber protein n=1 Tax=Arthrobacter phage vB_ArtM-ArV1 TaxID=1566993 RepID=A0A0A7HE43_9CAUD|nr:putative tail fiber protein [Arthrobacter phage vB_ArtM-ArV1]AIZ01710.1 putative tail fiber protein [Arthrobacter phage vB_ArtM-ArV1]
MSALQEAMRKPGRVASPDSVPSLYRGIVTEVRSDGMLWVLIPRLSGDSPIGPMPAASYALTVGERVLIGAVEDSRSDLMIICREYGDSSAFPAFEGVHLKNPPTGPDNAVRKDYADALGSVLATNDTIVRRGVTGSILVQEAYLGGVQSAANAATRKSYVDAQVALKMPKVPTLLPGTAHDLDDYQAQDIYHQSFNAAASISMNYPVPLAGLLECFAPSTTFIYQRYTTYNTTTRIFWRAKYSTSAWGGWKEVQDVASFLTAMAGKAALVHTHVAGDITGGVFAAALLPAATTGAQGAMSAADKTKLDAATINPTASTIAMRNSAGDLTSNNYFMPSGQAQSALPQSLTRRDYVDAQVATRAASSHGHTYADISGTVPTAALPPLAINETFPVASQAAMLALTAQRGDMAIRSDNGRSYVLSTDSPGTLADWKEIMAAGQVQSVAGKTGVVSLVKGDVGLGNVDNTADTAKPVSTATQTALNAKANTSHTHLWADLTDKPTTFAPSAHVHSAADLTSGTVPVARLPLATGSAAGAMSAADKATFDVVSVDTGWVDVPLTAPWVNYDAGVHATAQVRRIGNDVEFKAFLKSGSLGTNVGVIPAGFRPVSQRWPTATFQSTAIGSTFCVIYPDGTVYLAGSGAVTYVSIECRWMLG